MKLFARISTLVIIISTILGACAPKPAVARPPIRLEWTLWPGDYPITIAKEMGFFEKHGVQVEPVLYQIFSDAMPDLSAGKIDGGLFVVGDFLVSQSNDNLRAVMVADVSDGADQVVASADIASPADLRGKRIGVKLSTFGELFIREMLKSQNISPDEVNLVDLDAEVVPDSIPSKIDAGHTWEPYTTAALSKGQHVIFDSSQTPGLIPDVLALRTDIVRDRPEDVKGMIEAWFEAVKYWQDHPNESKAIIAKYASMKPEEVSATGDKIYTLEDNLQAFQPGKDARSIYYAAQLNLDFLIKTGNITSQMDVNKLLDASFLQDISKKP
jgi:NitT/TauT family transport system substrate-binding protein